MLQCDVLVRSRLRISVLLAPGNLEHLFEGHEGDRVLLLALVHLAEVLINDDCFLVVIRLLDEISR